LYEPPQLRLENRKMPHELERTVIVVPCYNEAGRLKIDAFRAAAEQSPVEFLFVDDGSTDATLHLLNGLSSSEPGRFRVLQLSPNRGKAEAVRRGICAAIEGGAQAVGFWDADLATPLSVIPEFCDLLRERPEIEMVFGVRVPLLGRAIRRNPFRQLASRVFARLASTVLGISLFDTQCGAKLFRVTADLRRLFEKPFHSNWIFDVEIVARLIAARRETQLPRPDQVIYEYPLTEWTDVEGSKVKAFDFLRAVAELTKIYWTYLRRPIF